MDPNNACVSCRFENKSVCHSSSSTSQYCSDFDLFSPTMTTTDQAGDEKANSLRVKRTSTGWAFQGATVSEIQYDEDIEADFKAVANDSGYFSSPPLEASSRDTPSSSNPTKKKENVESRKASSVGSLYADTAASVKPNYGSIYDMIDIADAKKRTRPQVYDDFEEDDSPSWPSLFSDAITAPTPLDLWERSHHRHELLAYRLEQPTKRRRISRC